MNILILDTETIDLQKRFCYNLGYIVYDTIAKEAIIKSDFVIEQVWHNIALFETAYYANKKEKYIASLRSKKSKLIKWGFLMQKLYYLMQNFEITSIYAYNSPFDESVIKFNCEWFKTLNPFYDKTFFDIRGYVHNKIAFNPSFIELCEANNFFTEAENISTTAENVYKFISKNIDFIEEHTALADCEIELEILQYCINEGSKLDKVYPIYRTIKRDKPIKQFTLVDIEKNEHIFDYKEKRFSKNQTILTLK